MKKIFDIDSPMMQGLSVVGDLLILNILAVVCSLPIFTIGASMTALYDAVFHMQKGEEHSVKRFFAIFKSNFRQSTALWILFCGIGAILFSSLLLSLQIANLIALVLRIVLCVMAALYLMALAWVFPLQAKFYNTVGNTIKNAFICAMSNRLRSIIGASINIVPIVIFACYAELFLKLGFIWVIIWFALAAYCNAKILKKPVAELVEQSIHEREAETQNLLQ